MMLMYGELVPDRVSQRVPDLVRKRGLCGLGDQKTTPCRIICK